MFVVYCVELVFLHQTHQVREFHCYNSIGPQNDLHTPDKVIYLGYMSQDIVTDEQVGVDTSPGEFFCTLFRVEFDDG